MSFLYTPKITMLQNNFSKFIKPIFSVGKTYIVTSHVKTFLKKERKEREERNHL